MDFLREKAETSGHAGLKKKLEDSEKSGALRPDEAALKQQIQQSERPVDIAQGALAGAAGLAGGALGAGVGAGIQAISPQEEMMRQQQPAQIENRQRPQIEDQRYAQMGQQPAEVIPAEYRPGSRNQASMKPKKKGLLAELEEAHQREYGNRTQRGSNSDDQLLALLEQALKM